MANFFARTLLKWYEENPRPLPWADGLRDPYKIWLSEIIMQQTRIMQGTSYYLKFIKTYPTLRDLADAPLDDVLRLWEGLGYYTRARNMHKTAKQIVDHLCGQFPNSYEGLLSLPGIGPYSAAAIASFAFGKRHVVVDGNVKRLIARFAGLKESIDLPSTHDSIRDLAQEYMKGVSPDIFNQAIMNFGALVCKPSSPLCHTCPLSKKCFAFQHGFVSVLPARTKKKSIRNRYFHFVFLHYRNKILLHRRDQKDIWHSLYALPLIERNSMRSPGHNVLSSFVSALTGHLKFILRSSGAEVSRQTLSHQMIYGRVYKIDVKSKPVKPPDEFVWVPIVDLPKYGKPKMVVEFLNSAL